MTQEQEQAFINLASRLSPENLCCDGLATKAQVRKRLAQIRREWKALEKEVGRKVTENQAWGFHPSFKGAKWLEDCPDSGLL